ncbi:PglZ domain-containing protein [Methanospirillum purgamenti]|uniref:PglZ domain-containing protein n=1 Tax=Methanospirillum hungatei TaxID=2203 RepID=A0A8F5VPV3_METHU|nr:PglZ domain-containing protein [Methanospirillum hungatei]QXO96036.1 PglZ domain-containing protein [Methanospirillum hungatei]
MTSASDNNKTFHSWLSSIICPYLNDEHGWVLWYDSQGEWKDILKKFSSDSNIEYWDGEEIHELNIRYTLNQEPHRPRIIRLPIQDNEMTWFAIEALKAPCTKQLRLAEALRSFGAEIPWDQEQKMGETLKSYALQWFDETKDVWTRSGSDNIITDARVLEIIGSPTSRLSDLKQDEFILLSNRLVHEFGLPEPTLEDEKKWRREVVATLLCTEIARQYPGKNPGDSHRVIPEGKIREKTLKNILDTWKNTVPYFETYERIVLEAERLTSIRSIAPDIPDNAEPSSSYHIERELFRREISSLISTQSIQDLAQILSKRKEWYQSHTDSFFGNRASVDHTVWWSHLLKLSSIAQTLLVGNAINPWSSVMQAIEWYTQSGYTIDEAGELLFEEKEEFSDDINEIRDRLKRLYLQIVSHIGSLFSERLAHDCNGISTLETAGEKANNLLQLQKGPLVFIFLDALRYDLGVRLAAMLNQGEGGQRAQVHYARASLPSITMIGKPHSLPISSSQLKVSFDETKGNFTVTTNDFLKDLTVAGNWRDWFSRSLGVKQFMLMDEVLSGDIKKPNKNNPMMVVEGGELDASGTIGELKQTGAENLLRRYTKGIKKIREKGWNRFVIVTDHGYFHWQPGEDDIETIENNGNILWQSRRAVVGRNLSSTKSLILPASGSDLTVRVPWSTNAFKTYGGLGFFHGGATLQEIIIPVIYAEWPQKTTEITIVLKPVQFITSLTPRVQIEDGGQKRLFGADESLSGRTVLVKVRDKEGRVVFKQKEPISVNPGGGVQTIQLELVPGAPALLSGEYLMVCVEDAENEQRLAEEQVELRQDIDDW